MKREEIIKEIFDKIEDALYEQDDFEIERDGEFGGIDASINVTVDYKTCQVQCDISYNAHREDWLELIIYPNNDKHDLTNLEEAVNDYFAKHFDMRSLLDAMEEKVIEAEEDEWTSHGFRDEADYLRWRFG